MKPDIEKLLAEVQPHEPSPDLRSKVLAAVDAEFAETKTITRSARLSTYARWERRFARASVIALLFAVGLNFLAYGIGEARLAQFRPKVSEPCYIAEITDTIRDVANPETAEWFREKLVARWQEKRFRPCNKDAYKHYQQILQQVAVFEKELCYVQPQKVVQPQKRKKGPKTGRDRPGRPSSDTSYYQWPGGLDHQFTG